MAYRTTAKMAKRKERRRRHFLDVGTRLFGTHGYHQTTVPMVVQEAGSSTGSFYFYFRNKEHLFADVLAEAGRRVTESLSQAIERHEGAGTRMRAAVEQLFLFLAKHPAEARILLIETSGLGGDLEKARQEIVSAHSRSVRQALDHLKGRRAPGDARVLARCWVGAVYEAARQWLQTPESDRGTPERIAKQVADFNLRGAGIQE